jgi:predicted permease
MHTLIAAQVAFCFLVHFVAGLFVSTFDRLAHQPTGFAAERVLTLEANALREQPIVHWNQALDHLRSTTGVEAAALCGWPLLSGNSRSNNIWVDGRTDDDPPYFLPVTAGFFDTMGIPLLGGRDFRPDDQFPMRGIVNEAFARRYFDGRNPVGRTIEVSPGQGKRAPLEIVGYVRDTRYQEMREAMHPTVFIPFTELDAKGAERGRDWATFVVRTSSAAGNPLNLAPALRREVPRARSELRVSDIHTQTELVEQHTVRERLLAALSLFFALVALLLSGVGLYGVLNYSVLQRRREIGIRLALGAPAREVARRILAEIALMLTLGAATGLAAGIAGSRYLETLLYQVKATDLTIIIVPVLTILAAAVLASLPPLWTAIRIDPMSTLRTE